MFLDPYVEDATRDESRTLGVLGVGLGLQFSQRYTVTVAIAQRVSVSSGSSSHMMLGGAMGFGKR